VSGIEHHSSNDLGRRPPVHLLRYRPAPILCASCAQGPLNDSRRLPHISRLSKGWDYKASSLLATCVCSDATTETSTRYATMSYNVTYGTRDQSRQPLCHGA
jgi:hypothetical protein